MGLTMLEDSVPLTTTPIKCMVDQLPVHSCQTVNEKKKQQKKQQKKKKQTNKHCHFTLTLDSGNMNGIYWGDTSFDIS